MLSFCSESNKWDKYLKKISWAVFTYWLKISDVILSNALWLFLTLIKVFRSICFQRLHLLGRVHLWFSICSHKGVFLVQVWGPVKQSQLSSWGIAPSTCVLRETYHHEIRRGNNIVPFSKTTSKMLFWMPRQRQETQVKGQISFMFPL